MSKTATKERPLTRLEVERKRVADVAAHATKAFSEHRIQALWVALPFDSACDLGVQAWRCGQPSSGIYAFTIFAPPGRLIVCGDIGTLVLERTHDMLAWARGSIHDIGYFAEKVVREIETKEYDPDMVRGWAAELDQEILEGEREYGGRTAKAWLGDGLRRDILQAAEDSGSESRVLELIHESEMNDGSDYPDFTNWKHGFLWQREAIKWFLARRLA